jgi:hypothetical protein
VVFSFGLLMEGLERRLLEKPRRGFSTAVAFPQKSESDGRRRKKSGDFERFLCFFRL